MFDYFRNCLSNIPIMFHVKVVRLKVYMTIARPVALVFIQGHACVSNVTIWKRVIYRTTFKLLHSQTWHDGRLMYAWHILNYTNARFDDLDHDINFEIVWKARPTCCIFCGWFIWQTGRLWQGRQMPILYLTFASNLFGVLQWSCQSGRRMGKLIIFHSHKW